MSNILNGLQNAIAVVTNARTKLAERTSSDNIRIESDRIARREPGGERPGNHLDNDWAGREILGNYLIGGGDQVITNDPNWTAYMQNNHILSNELDIRAVADAQQLFNMSNDQVIRIDENFPTQIENGESIVGYQYLHGTNGGLGRTGIVDIVRNADGTATVNLNMQYSWNDVIDPNNNYTTDTIKNRIAEIATLGQADPYDMQINWSENTQIILDKDGNVTKINRDAAPDVQRNFPGNRNDDPTIESIRTESTRDTNAASSPVTNVTTTTHRDGTTTTQTTVTSPTGGTYSASNNSDTTNNSGQSEDHKSTADEKQEAADRRGTMDVSSPGGTPGGLGQVHG